MIHKSNHEVEQYIYNNYSLRNHGSYGHVSAWVTWISKSYELMDYMDLQVMHVNPQQLNTKIKLGIRSWLTGHASWPVNRVWELKISSQYLWFIFGWIHKLKEDNWEYLITFFNKWKFLEVKIMFDIYLFFMNLNYWTPKIKWHLTDQYTTYCR